jgi:hypothetical protein
MPASIESRWMVFASPNVGRHHRFTDILSETG